ncbi:MAG TPA: hypothetical protein VF981_06095 [Gemmatimonadaceae bacterium]|jgi:hypothetical protein
MSPMQIFRKSIFSSECDECGHPFPVNQGGVCDRCRRILCNTHLHGSAWRRLSIALGAPYRCVTCRAGREPAASRPDGA